MSNGVIKHGVQLDLQRGPLSMPFTEQEQGYSGPDSAKVTGSEAIAGVDQTPLDRAAAKVRTFDIAAITAAALAQPALVVLGKTRVQSLPSVLKEIKVTYTKSGGAGAASHPVSTMAGSIIGIGSVSFTPRASAQGSASITPTLTWSMDEPGALLVNCENYFFFAESPMNMTTVLAKINLLAATTVADLPLFYDREIQFVVRGGQTSVRASADTNLQLSANVVATTPTASGAQDLGTESSLEVGLQTQREVIPRSLHAAITTLTDSDTKTVTVDVEVSTPALSYGGITFGAIDNHPTAVVGTATASIIIPSEGNAHIPATTPTDIPRTGRYLVEITGEEDIFGLVKVHAVVVDFAQFVWP